MNMSKTRTAIPTLLCKCFFFFFFNDGSKSITMQIKAVMMEVPVCIFSMDPVCLFMSEIFV